MALGIVRAADRVAVWHDAAGNPFADPDAFQKLQDEALTQAKPSTSEPPAGAPPPSPGGTAQPVQVTKSKKFLTPANNLKTVLEKAPAPEQGKDLNFAPHTHAGLTDWFKSHPDFAKSYMKPQYKEMLRAHLGDDAYKKLVYHMPGEHYDTLHTHEQAPAPKSNKFKPVWQLEDLLNNPNTTPEHVESWVDKHPAFAKTYLHNPSYQDAIKKALGESNYAAWAEHLKPGGSAPKPETVKGGPSWQDDIDAIKAEQAKPAAPGLGDKLKAAVDTFDAPSWNKLHHDHPDQAKQVLQQYIDAGSGSGALHATAVKALQQIYDEHFGDADEIDAIKQEIPQQGLGDKAKAIFPELHPGVVQSLNELGPQAAKSKLQNYLLDNPAVSEKHPELTKLLSEQFNKPAPGQPGFTPAMHGKFLQDIKGVLQSDGYGNEDQMSQFLDGLDSDEAAELAKPHNGNAAVDAYEEWLSGPATAPNQDDPWATPPKAPVNEQPPPNALKPGQEGMLDAWMKEHPDYQAPPKAPAGGFSWMPTPEQMAHAGFPPEIGKGADEKWWENQLKAVHAHDPGTHGSAWEDLLEQKLKEQAAQAPPTKTPTAQHDALVAGIKKIFPDTPLDLQSMSIPELKAQLETWQKHLDHPDLAGHLNQVNALHEQHFGQGAQQSAAPVGLGDKLTTIFPKLENAEEWNQADPEQQQSYLQTLMEAFPDKADALQQLSDEHFGQGAQQAAQPASDDPYGYGDDTDKYTDPYGMNGPPQHPGFQKYLRDQGIDPQTYEWSPSVWNDYATNQMKWQQEHGNAEPVAQQTQGKPSSVGEQLKALIGQDKPKTAEQMDAELAKKTPEQIKKLFDNTAEGHPEMADALQKIYEQNYGAGAQQPASGGTPGDPATMAADFAKIIPGHKWNFSTPLGVGDFKNVVGDVLKPDYDLKNDQFINTPEKLQQVKDFWAKHFGSGEPGGALAQALSHANTDQKKIMSTPAFKEYFQSLPPAEQMGDWSANEAAYQKFKYGVPPSGVSVYQQAVDQANARASGGGGLDKTKTPTEEQLLAIGLKPGQAKTLAKQDPEKFWGTYDWFINKKQELGDKFAEPGMYPPAHAWNKILNGLGQGAPAGGQPVPFDQADLIEEIKKADPTYWSPGGYGYDSMIGSSPEGWQQKLQDLISTGNLDSSEEKQVYENLLGKYFGGGEGASPQKPSDFIKSHPGQQPPDLDAFVAEVSHMWPSTGPTFAGKSAEEAKAKLEGFLVPGKYGPGVQEHAKELLDKYFSGGAKATTVPFDNKTLAQEVGELTGIGSQVNFNGTKFSEMTPEQAKNALQESIDNDGYGKGTKEYQALYDKYFGGGAQATSIPTYDPVGAFADYAKWFPGSPNKGKFDTPEGAQAQLKQVIKNTISPSKKEKHEALQAIYDKWFGGGAQAAPEPPFVPPPYDPKTFGEEYAAIVPGSQSSVAQGTADEAKAKDKVQGYIDQFPDTEQTQGLKKLYQKWWGPLPTVPGQEPPAPAPSLTPEQVEQQLYSKLLDFANHTAGSEHFPAISSPEFKQWFSGQLLTKQKQFAADPELAMTAFEQDKLPPPEPTKPFKSQKLVIADLNKWAGGKPKSEAEWKNFAAWWGNTQLSPTQERGLYNAWFNKNATAEKAATWFQQVFEHHSQPSEGDLGAEGIPAWAHNSWAFGKNAEKQWPVFKQWAAKDPGLSKGLSFKQKLLVWNGLSAGEKSEIMDNYAPANPPDTAGILGAFQKAYPDSDWGAWAKMAPGTLAKNVKMLAESGSYPAAIPIYNKFFGGKIPEIKEEPKVEGEKEKPKSIPTVPIDALPDWVKGEQITGFSATPAGAKKYTDFKHWADLVGKGDIAAGGKDPEHPNLTKPYYLYKQYNELPEHLKAQVAAMPKPLWDNEEGYQQWKAAQPTLQSEVKALYPQDDKYWASYNQKKNIEGYLGTETDPQKKQALLGIYHKYYGTGKETLAEALKKAAPLPPKGAKDWDTYLQTHTPDDAAKLVKKQLKVEQDPDKFVQLADIWSKYFSGPAGHKQLGQALGKNHTGGSPLGLSAAKYLHKWKAEGGDPAEHYQNNGYTDTSPYLETKKAKGEDYTVTYPKFYGWTPPSGDATDYTPDPALFGSTPAKTYAVPLVSSGGRYTDLMQNAKKFEPPSFSPSSFSAEYDKALPGVSNGPGYHAPTNREQAESQVAGILRDYPDLPPWQRKRLEDIQDKWFSSSGFSAKDKGVLASDGFQQWFNAAPPKYQEVKKLHPGAALDDYQGFLQGEDPYPPVPEGPGKKVNYDLTPLGLAPYTKGGDPKTVYQGPSQFHHDPSKAFESENTDSATKWPGFTRNPMRPGERKEYVKTPEVQESPGQQEIELPPGETFEPKKKPVELHRGIGLNLGMYDNKVIKPPSKAMEKSDPKQYDHDMGEYQRQLHRKWLSDLIRARIGGSQTESKEAIPDLFNTAEGDDKSQHAELPEKFKNKAPSGITEMFDFNKWAQKNHVPPEQIYELAKKWGVDDPSKYGLAPPSEGPWTKGMGNDQALQTDPTFAHLILDLLEASDYHGGQGFAPPGSLGDHWSLQKGTSTSFGGGNNFNVLVSGDWGGLGENPGNAHAVVDFSSEHEINLSPGAPVLVKRVRINSPSFGWPSWHDLAVKPHIRHATVALPRPRYAGHRPEQLYDLAVAWGIPNPERYGIPPRRRPAPIIGTCVPRKHGQRIVRANDSIWIGT
jgi:hypothetical protein